jgi:hypothetical protein
VTDRATQSSQTVTRPFEVLPKAFGLVRLTTTGDPQAQVPVPVIGEGQSLFLNFAAVGFSRDPSQKVKLAVEMRILDANAQPTLAKPFTGAVAQDLPKTEALIPMQFVVVANRSGNFTVELKATDQVSNKTAKLTVPLTIAKAK